MEEVPEVKLPTRVVKMVAPGLYPQTNVQWLEETEKLHEAMMSAYLRRHPEYQNNDNAYPPEIPTPSMQIMRVCAEVCAMLLAKNADYGNSALEPLRVFAKSLPPSDMIRVRLDDKLSRLQGITKIPEDTELDIMGYLVLLRIANHNEELMTNGMPCP